MELIDFTPTWHQESSRTKVCTVYTGVFAMSDGSIRSWGPTTIMSCWWFRYRTCQSDTSSGTNGPRLPPLDLLHKYINKQTVLDWSEKPLPGNPSVSPSERLPPENRRQTDEAFTVTEQSPVVTDAHGQTWFSVMKKVTNGDGDHLSQTPTSVWESITSLAFKGFTSNQMWLLRSVH